MRWLQHFLFGGTLPVLTDDSKKAAEARSNHQLFSEEQQLQGSYKVLYDAVGELSPGLSEEAFSTLCEDARALELNQITLNFRNSAVEAEFQQHVAIRRRPVLLLVFCFDVVCYLFRMAAKFVRTDVSLPVLCKGIMPQLCNMGLLYFFLGLLNRRSRRLGDSAARQEEFMLTGVMTLAICNLLATINEVNPQDYVYAAMFMISTTCFLKIQWLLGTAFMSLPLLVTHLWHRNSNVLPTDAMVHLTVSWAVGGFMSYLSDTYRRQMFVNRRLAKIAAEKELQEAQARINVQQQLSAAQAQAAQRAIVVVREKAANEAKSEFMSLMCHEVRTPLNGCLASAEMLLEMPLQEEQRELAKTIRVSGSILLSTVSNFLDFFKMEAGKQLDVVRTEMTTKELVGDIHCIIEATIGRSSAVMLEKPNTDGVPDYVLGDPDRLRGILLNLYTNAAKFTKRGSIALRVRVAKKDYRPSPAQVIAQQGRGPYARVRGDQQHGSANHSAAEQNGQYQEHASWGSIEGVSPQRKPAWAKPEQPRSQSMASAFSHAPAAASHNSLLHASEAWRKGPGARAATNAGMALHRGHDAEDASDAVNQAHSITTPVQCEHLAGHTLLQHAAQAIDRAADKMQADAGLSPVGSISSLQRGRKQHASDFLEPVKEDTADSMEAVSRQGAKVFEPRAELQGAVADRFCHSPQGSGQAAEQHAGTPAKFRKSSSGRASSTSVLDQQDDSSSCSGGSAPSDSKAPPPEADRQSAGADSRSGSQALQEDAFLRDTVRPRSASQQGRHSGTARSTLGERTQSNSDITESDTSYRCSSGSFSDYPPPMRKSLSSPALHEALITGKQDANPAGQRRSLGGLTATSYNGMSSGKATVGTTVATTVQDLGDGWFNTVAHRKAPVLVETMHSDETRHREEVRATDQVPDTKQIAFQGPMSPADPEGPGGESDQWLVFEVTDTGCGISQHGLGSLFTEYVQGTEDDMKRPRTRGGTGLGLSICSKQVSVLGGLLGAMSKVGEGSTFWFTIPLLKPTQSFNRESLSMRRTASWGSRDAFTDGHISHHADPPAVPAGRRTLAATTRAHRHKRHYTPARSATYQAMQQQQDPSALHKNPSLTGQEHLAGNLLQRQFPSEEALRRMSAPAAPPDRPGAGEVPRKAQSTASNNSTAGSQNLDHTTAQARAAVARAVLCEHPSASSSGPSSQRSSSSSSDSGRASSCRSSQDSMASAASPERESEETEEASTSQPRQHRNVDTRDEGGTIAPCNGLQRNLLAQYKSDSEGSRMRAQGAQGAIGPSFGRGQPLQPLPEGSPSPFQAPDGELMQRRAGENGFGSGRSPSSSESGSRGLNMRPSMEARRRRLGLSALQGRSVLLAEDNLINQRVAKMMLCSLGMCCEVASNGQEAVDAVVRRIGREDARQFDVLLMDMAMPVMGGVDATKEIRRAGAAVPIVAMTANSSDKDRDECLEAGMDGFLSKPVLKDRLAEAILNAVSGRRQFQDRQTISLKAYDRL